MKRTWIVVVAAWAVVLGALAYWSLRTDKATVRDQTTIGQALPTVDAALGRIASLVDSDRIEVLAGYARIGGDCRITVARSGARYQRVLDVYLREGDEGALLDKVKAGVPAGWKATVLHGTGVQALQADAGNFVAIRGAMLVPGQVRFLADTGCRPMPHPIAAASPGDATAQRAAAQRVFDALKLAPGGWTTEEVACATGGTVRTVQATAPTAPSLLAPSLKSLPGTVVVARPELYAAGTPGKTGVVARAVDGHLVVAASTGCGAQ